MRPRPPLDDTLTMAATCAGIMLDLEAPRTYRRLMAKVIEASAEWDHSDAGRRAILDVYRAELRKGLGLPPMRRRRPGA